MLKGAHRAEGERLRVEGERFALKSSVFALKASVFALKAHASALEGERAQAAGVALAPVVAALPVMGQLLRHAREQIGQRALGLPRAHPRGDRPGQVEVEAIDGVGGLAALKGLEPPASRMLGDPHDAALRGRAALVGGGKTNPEHLARRAPADGECVVAVVEDGQVEALVDVERAVATGQDAAYLEILVPRGVARVVDKDAADAFGGPIDIALAGELDPGACLSAVY